MDTLDRQINNFDNSEEVSKFFLYTAFYYAHEAAICTEKYAEVVPGLIFEVKSKNDSLKKLQEKIEEFLSLGTTLGF